MLNNLQPAPLLPSAPNFRDLGGYASEDGRRVRTGLIYRSQSLSELSEHDLALAAKLDIRLICDLRSDSERQQSPSCWPEHPQTEVLHLDISADLRAGYVAMTKVLLENPSSQGATQAMLRTYEQFPTAFAPHLRTLFDRLLSDSHLPLIFNCTAGKDRTGFLAAILLSALGVPWHQILDDYLITAKLWHGPRSAATVQQALYSLFGKPPAEEVLLPLLSVDERYLTTAFAAIISQYKSVDAYLEATAGLNPARRTALKNALLK